MKLSLLCVLAVVVVAVSGQPNSPSTYNAQNKHLSDTDPCADITVQGWSDVPQSRITLDPNFDDGVPADYASPWNGQDNLYKYPNGFRKGQVYEDNNPPFCFNVYGVQNKQVQVMLQTTDDLARLCIKDVTSNGVRMGGTIDRCFTDKHTACFSGLRYSNSLTLMVYLDSTGTTTSTAFWYRVRTSGVTWDLTDASDRANSAIQTLEMWCMMQDQDPALMRYPKELRSVVPPDVQALSVGGGASAQSVSVVAVMALALVTVVAIFRQ